MKKFTANKAFLVLILLAVAMTSLTIYIVNKEKAKYENKEPEKIYVGYEDGKKLENFTREKAVDAMRDILVSIKKDVDGKDRTIEERMKALDNPKTELKDVISQETIDKLYLSDEFKKEKFNRQFAASVLLTYHQLISETSKNKEFKPLLDDFSSVVYLDNKMKNAQIPLDVFIGENRGIAFEMQYIDGEWKLNPYTAMMSLVMIVNYEGQIEKALQDKNASESKSEEKADKK